VTSQDSNQNFRDAVALSRLVDPRSTLENLAATPLSVTKTLSITRLFATRAQAPKRCSRGSRRLYGI
jgi:hypothetical protein